MIQIATSFSKASMLLLLRGSHLAVVILQSRIEWLLAGPLCRPGGAGRHIYRASLVSGLLCCIPRQGLLLLRELTGE